MVDVTAPPAPATSATERKRRGAFDTPSELVDRVVAAVVDRAFVAAAGDRPVTVLDPACGDGRFLAAVAARVASFGGRCELVGIDIDAGVAAVAADAVPGAHIEVDDARAHDWAGRRFDLVVGNPPFLSQLAAATTRGGASELGGGPYADVAVEFLALAERLVDHDHGRVAFVLPQSVLSARDAAPVRERFDERAEMFWSWWSDERVFDANVYTCALAFRFGADRTSDPVPWSSVVSRRRRIPPLGDLPTDAGALGDRARLNANFRDEYYGMVPAVGDHDAGPPLITSGLIDPGVSRWGERPVTFARRRFAAPRVDLDRLDPRMTRWARQRLVPKVLVANQTTVVEALCDPNGDWLPAVPVVAVYPHEGGAQLAWEIAAVLTSPVASAWAWARSAGTGLSPDAIRLSPVTLAELPWPGGPLGPAVDALRAGDVRGCGSAVDAAYGLAAREDLGAWWRAVLDRIERRRPA